MGVTKAKAGRPFYGNVSSNLKPDTPAIRSTLRRHTLLICAVFGYPLIITRVSRLVSLTPGTRIGSYGIAAQIGVGGMGEVYRAHDTKLGRDVAIKILPSHFTSDPGRLARFEREARVLASLNHPHIGAIYGLEDADGVRALVLELVEGDTLAERIARGPLALSDALTIARQIADALDAVGYPPCSPARRRPPRRHDRRRCHRAPAPSR